MDSVEEVVVKEDAVQSGGTPMLVYTEAGKKKEAVKA
jgi:hypothetical protein